MRRTLLTMFATVAILTIGAQAARAAILPACDQTVYLVRDSRKVDLACDPSKNLLEGCCDLKNRKACLELSPDQYNTEYNSEALRSANPPIITSSSNACGLNDFVQLFINLANWGLGVMALLALGYTVWGGYTLMESAGSAEKVKEGKQTIWGGVLGITIILTAWVIIGFVVSALTGTGFTLFKNVPGFGDKYARNFFGTPGCGKNYKTECSADNLQIQCQDTKNNQSGVSQAQNALAKLSCYKRSVDGCFGTNTQQAVKDFQTANQGCSITIGVCQGNAQLTCVDNAICNTHGAGNCTNAQFRMPDYTTGNQKPSGVITSEVWAFLKGANEGIQENCPAAPATSINVHGC